VEKPLMNKGILILGGGILQVPALLKAKELGLTTYLTDGLSDCYARGHADHFFEIDTKDVESNAALAVDLKRQGKIEAVYTQGADLEYAVAYAAEKAGLPGIPVEAALNCNSKIRMREILAASGLDDTKFAHAKTFDEFKAAIRHVGFPCYVKPVDNCASRGLTRLDREAELASVFEKAMSACVHMKELIVESEIAGAEYSVDTVMVDGKLYPAGVSDRNFLKKELYAVQSGSTTPSLLPEKIQAEMYRLMEKAALTLGVRQGAFKGDLVVNPRNQVRIIEVAARTSGGFDSQYRKPYSFGIDIIKATMDIARGLPADPRDLVPKWVKWSRTFSVFPAPGKVVAVEGVDEVQKLSGVRNVFILVKPGDHVEPLDDCAKRTNHIVISADSLAELDALQEKVTRTLKIATKEAVEKLSGVRNAFIHVKPGDQVEPLDNCAKRRDHIVISADGLVDALQEKVTDKLKIATKETE
jgi:biotin carboxylase